MWPWGHAAVGYLLYSPLVRLWRGRTPAASEVLALGIGTQLPDLVDKPLAWVFGVFPQGYSVAHSVFVAVPVGVAVAALAARRDRPALGVALTLGYWSHLVADVGFALAVGEPRPAARVLWPLVTLPAYGTTFTAGERITYYLARWLAYLQSSAGLLAVLAYLSPLVAALALWALDGAPGLPVGGRSDRRPGD
ncbi:MAG: metal-dependent hydrolase [Haloarculaceae archaeon]